jgi:hypothetical protein
MAVEDEESRGGKIYVYHGTGPRKECLRGAVLESRNPIYECHAGCACSEDCKNRVVEWGRKVPLQIFRTDNGRGWGKAPSFLPPSFLCQAARSRHANSSMLKSITQVFDLQFL